MHKIVFVVGIHMSLRIICSGFGSKDFGGKNASRDNTMSIVAGFYFKLINLRPIMSMEIPQTTHYCPIWAITDSWYPERCLSERRCGDHVSTRG